MRYRVIDVETTGVEATDHVVEIASWDIDVPEGAGGWRMWESHNYLVRPPVPIPAIASAVHHLTDEDVKDARPWDEVWPLVASPDVGAYVAHQSKFERQWLGAACGPWICTYRGALRVWPEAPSHGNQALRYWLDGLHSIIDREKTMPAHRASPDAYVTAHLLRRILEGGVAHQQLIEWTEQPALLARIRFGKHEGTKFSELPPDYLQWLCNQGKEMDEDVRYTARHYLDEIDKRRLEERRRENLRRWGGQP